MNNVICQLPFYTDGDEYYEVRVAGTLETLFCCESYEDAMYMIELCNKIVDKVVENITG